VNKCIHDVSLAPYVQHALGERNAKDGCEKEVETDDKDQAYQNIRRPLPWVEETRQAHKKYERTYNKSDWN
jgi:hypothetical protein